MSKKRTGSPAKTIILPESLAVIGWQDPEYRQPVYCNKCAWQGAWKEGEVCPNCKTDEFLSENWGTE